MGVETVSPATQAAISGATVAALATVFGYLFNQARARRERKAKAFAKAMAAMRRFYDFPHKVWRRSVSDAATRDRLSEERSRGSRAVRFHLIWLKIESPVVGEAYEQLWTVVHRARLHNANLAWASPPRATDRDLVGEPPCFVRKAGTEETDLCILAMRNELSWWPGLRRPRIRRALETQKRQRVHASGMTTTP
jgi:hypothetical protein